MTASLGSRVRAGHLVKHHEPQSEGDRSARGDPEAPAHFSPAPVGRSNCSFSGKAQKRAERTEPGDAGKI